MSRNDTVVDSNQHKAVRRLRLVQILFGAFMGLAIGFGIAEFKPRNNAATFSSSTLVQLTGDRDVVSDGMESLPFLVKSDAFVSHLLRDYGSFELDMSKEELRSMVSQAVEVTPQAKSLIRITASYGDPHVSQRIAAAVAQLLTEKAESMGQNSLIDFESQLQRTDSRLNAAKEVYRTWIETAPLEVVVNSAESDLKQLSAREQVVKEHLAMAKSDLKWINAAVDSDRNEQAIINAFRSHLSDTVEYVMETPGDERLNVDTIRETLLAYAERLEVQRAALADRVQVARVYTVRLDSAVAARKEFQSRIDVLRAEFEATTTEMRSQESLRPASATILTAAPFGQRAQLFDPTLTFWMIGCSAIGMVLAVPFSKFL